MVQRVVNVFVIDVKNLSSHFFINGKIKVLKTDLDHSCTEDTSFWVILKSRWTDAKEIHTYSSHLRELKKFIGTALEKNNFF